MNSKREVTATKETLAKSQEFVAGCGKGGLADVGEGQGGTLETIEGNVWDQFYRDVSCSITKSLLNPKRQ
jgi:hypothetical protein